MGPAFRFSTFGKDPGYPPRMETIGLIAGNGAYPLHTARAARRKGVKKIVVVAFHGETDPAVAEVADCVEWVRVGQLNRLIQVFLDEGVTRALMVGQIAPKNLFRDVRLDLRMAGLLARLKERNAESIFGAIGDELAREGIELLDARTFLEEWLAPAGHFAGPPPSEPVLEDIRFGVRIVRGIAAMDIGQSVVVKKGTVLAVEALEGTDETIRRGGRLGRGKVVVVKASKPSQDMRFDVPVVGEKTLEVAREAGVSAIGVEARSTLILDRPRVEERARKLGVSLVGWEVGE